MNGWCDFAIRLDGPAEKTGYNGAQKTHAKVGVVIHTMEYESTPEWNDATTLHNALFSDREASWTFSICRFFGGSLLFQHYPVGTVCWAQGYQGNLWLDSIETEGIAPEKFSESQLALLVKVLRWIREAHGWAETSPWMIGARGTPLEKGWVAPILFEHNAVPGAPATDCAVFTRGQVDPQRLIADLEEDDMDEAQVRAIIESYFPLAVTFDGDPHAYWVNVLTQIDSPDYLQNVKVLQLSANHPLRRVASWRPDGLG